MTYPDDALFGRLTLIRCPDCNEATLVTVLDNASRLKGWLKQASFNGYRTSAENRDGYNAALNLATRSCGWVALWGDNGVGKTHLLAATVNHCIARRVAGLYYTLPDLLDTLRAGFSDDSYAARMDRLQTVRVLAIDEIADCQRTNMTDWALEKMFQLLDSRYREIETKATIFASNLSPAVFTEEMHYLASRMSDDRGKIVLVGGGDVRPIRGEVRNG